MMWAWALLPVFLAVWGIVGVWVVFGIAVSNHSVNVTEQFPYISVCGSYSPQSSVFSQICNGCTFLIVWIDVIRYQQVRDLGDNCCHANRASLVIGLISAAAVSVLGNFQVSVWFWVHMSGAVLAFCLGLVYFWLQMWLTLKAEPSQDGHWVALLRALLCSLSTVFLLGIVVLQVSGFRSLAAISEWALVMTYFLLFGLFAVEFRHVHCFRVTVQEHSGGNKSYDRLHHNNAITMP
ncbi:modulator of macroautophagy TMEM150B-like isoform X2 [Alosa sapidissima]|uniref:modulator of macroautophagy TMEM150B-like isoform X1 n=1 Tax=Alosa sapidissima TaxID=34773 RepID=UPI001C0A0857|nr:modulator of macroautophagy TMEM150B-like isoform X1 [Alosa sapidissima]XP_041939100.1 modulator of macroautophagy TMEM150B-like isoform X2 [Alosa sapidissima]